MKDAAFLLKVTHKYHENISPMKYNDFTVPTDMVEYDSGVILQQRHRCVEYLA